MTPGHLFFAMKNKSNGAWSVRKIISIIFLPGRYFKRPFGAFLQPNQAKYLINNTYTEAQNIHQRSLTIL